MIVANAVITGHHCGSFQSAPEVPVTREEQLRDICGTANDE